MATCIYVLVGYVLAIVVGATVASAIDDWLSKRKRGRK